MKVIGLLQLILLASWLTGSEARSSGWAPDEAALKDLFHKPLIVGASVSNDVGTESPGRRLALRYTEADKIQKVAVSGATGVTVEPGITELVLRDRTVVIGIDLFFWDSTRRSSEPSAEALNRLMERVSKLGIPIVLGNIPALLGPVQLTRNPLNRKITEACKAYSKCHLFDLEAIYAKLLREGGITIGEKFYAIRELVPDGLHLSPVAADYLAAKILETF
jgi:hypothetical protein